MRIFDSEYDDWCDEVRGPITDQDIDAMIACSITLPAPAKSDHANDNGQLPRAA